VRQDMREMVVSDEMMNDREEWREKTLCVDPKCVGKRARRRRRSWALTLTIINENIFMI
jgi:hypothetical protein